MLTNTPIDSIILDNERRADFLLSKTRAQSKLERLDRFSLIAEMRPFLLEENMETKICFKCNQIKSVSEFYLYRIGKNKGYYYSYCKVCARTVIKEYTKKFGDWKKRFPWASHYACARTRCIYKYGSYFGRVKFLMTIDDFEKLWFRDKAYFMKRPSIDRKNSKGDYILSNCRFIEFSENMRRKKGATK